MPRNRPNVPRALACLAASLTLASCAEQRPPLAPEDAPVPGPSFTETTPFNNAGQCMVDDVNAFGGGPTNCTANDIRIARAYPTAGGTLTCTPGTSVTVNLTAEFQATSNAERQDIGAWVATDGGNGRTGACNHYNLPTNPLTTNTVNGDGDQCAGMSSSPTPNAVVELGTMTLPCSNIVTVGGETFLHVGSCLSWTVPGQDGVCADDRDGNGTSNQASDFRAATIPGTPAKCNCEGFNVPVQIVSQLSIVKNAVPDDAQDFAYTTSGAGLSSFSLDDDGETTILSNTKTFTGLVNDNTITRTVTETAVTGWTLTGIACTGATQSTVQIGTDGDFDTGDNSVSVVLKNGENVSCTFTNTASASLDIEKETVGGTATFNYTTSGTGLAAFSRNTAVSNPTANTPFSFSGADVSGDKYVTETALAGWTLTNITCTAGGATVLIGTGVGSAFSGDADFDAGDNTVKVTLAAGSSPACTFVNTKDATLDIEKQTVGGTGSFDFTTSGTGLSNFTRNTATQGNPTATTPFTFTGADITGDKYITETVPSGWALTDIQCTANGATILIGTGVGAGFSGDSDFDAGDNTVKVTLAAGSTPTCTFVNTVPTIGRLAPTQTSCTDFRDAPNATENNLTFVEYSRKGGVISQVNPGVFFYYSQIKLASAGTLTITTDQIANPAFKEFLVHNYPSTSQVNLYNATCTAIGSATVSFLDGGTRAQVTLLNAPAGDYILGIKFDPTSIVGEAISPNTQIVYTFATSVNGGGAVNSDALTLRPK